MERRLYGASEFRTKVKSTIAHVVSDSTRGNVASTRMLVTRKLFAGFCIKQTEQAAGDLAPGEALWMLEQQSE